MADQNETLQTLAAQVQQLHDTIAQQQAQQEELRDTIAQQQAQLQAMQARLETEQSADPTVHAATTTAPEPRQRSTRTSRRRLLTAAGAAAAATAAAVALGQGEVAHAATGSNLVLGQSNDAGATTTLTPSPNTAPSPVLTVTASGNTNVAIVGAGSNGAVGVGGTSADWYGVTGVSDSFIGVSGESNSYFGVYGYSPTSIGVFGESYSDIGVVGTSLTGIGGSFAGDGANIRLPAGPVVGAPGGSHTHYPGDIYVDSAATLWVCISGGSPGTWARLASVANGTIGGTVNYLASPIRLLDARSGAASGLVNRGPLTANEIYALSVAGLGGSGIPTGALGLICNVTVLGPSANGNLSLFPAGAPIPTTASMTFVAGAFLANHVNAALGSGGNQGQVNIQNQSGGNTPLVVDAVGFIM